MAAETVPLSRLEAKGARFQYRRVVDRMALVLVGLCAGLTIFVLLVILAYVVYRGASSINWAFLTALPRPVGEEGGGIGHAIVGSALTVGLATLLAVPIGVGAAILLNEFPTYWLGSAVRFLADVLTAVPSIVVGLAVYALVVLPMGTFSGFAGAVAYAFIMIPIILITTQEALRLVPTNLREASLALGVPRWKTILQIVLPTSSRALLTGLLLAVARALGETAPMLFTAFGNTFWNLNPFKATATIPLVIYRYAISPYDDWHRQAWAASLVLVIVVLLTSILTRLVLRREFED
jgi:phosphate transport system permease protein